MLLFRKMNTPSTSRFDIDPSSYPKDATYLSILAVWGLLVIGFGAFCFYKGFWVLGVLASLLILIIPVSWRRRNDIDSIVIRGDCIQILKNNKSSASTQIRKGATIELTLEFVECGDETESVPTLNLWDTYQGSRRRHILGLFISHPYREDLFDQLADFFEKSNFIVQSQNKIKANQDSKGHHPK